MAVGALLTAAVALVAAAFLPQLIAGAPARETVPLRLVGSGSSQASPAAAPAPAKEKKEKKPKSFEITGGARELYPGAEGELVLTVTNPWKFGIRVTSLSATVTGADRPGCSASALIAGSFSGSLIVPAEGSAVQEIPLRMEPDAPDACKAAVFSLGYSGLAERER